MSVTGLRCRECRREYPHAAVHVCDECFGPLDVAYDYDAIRRAVSRARIEERPRNLWRYRELLPLDGSTSVGPYSGMTPLVRADRLAAALGICDLYLKDDSVNHPTFSYKDRVVSVAIAKALELGCDTVACASTGNLANAVAAHARRGGLACFIFIPDHLEQAKVIGSSICAPHTIAVRGNYDDVNRLCSEIADKYRWAFVNINLRPYYTEGAKTFGFEIAEQLGWSLPQHVVIPTAGGTLLPKVTQAFRELGDLGLVDGPLPKIHVAQASGCAPIVRALHRRSEVVEPVKPNTIATSIAIGDPADGFYVLQDVRSSGGWGETATDDEILDGIRLLARTEGVFTEPAGGVTVAVTKKLIDQGRIPHDESVVIAITGNGYKTIEAVSGAVPEPWVIDARVQAFDRVHEQIKTGAPGSCG